MEFDDLEKEAREIISGLVRHLEIFNLTMLEREGLQDKRFLATTREAFIVTVRELRYVAEAHPKFLKVKAFLVELELFLLFLDGCLAEFKDDIKITAGAYFVMLEGQRDENDDLYGLDWRLLL